MPIHSFKLFVTGDAPRGRSAAQALDALCRHHLSKDYEIEVVNVLERPEEAEEYRIIVTPAVVKLRPPPPRRAVGDLREAEAVMRALSIVPEIAEPSEND